MIFQRISDNSFLTNMLILLKGSVFAKLLPLLIMPLLTRLYSVEAFGVLSLYTGIASIATVIATGRYEKAILLPKSHRESVALLVLTFLLSFTLLIVFEFILLMMASKASSHADFGNLVYLLPVFIFFLSAHRSILTFLNRLKLYKLMSISIIILAVVQASSKLFLGFFGAASGLIIATIFAYCICVVFLARQVRLFAVIKSIKVRNVTLVIKKYLDQPRYQLLADTVNAASLQAPILLTSYLFDLETVGLLSLAVTITLYPSAFIGNSISSVYRQESMKKFNKTGEFCGIYKSLVKTILLAAIIPLILFYLFIPDVVSLVFGENWEKAADIAKIMVFMVVFQFIDRITAYSYIMMNKQQEFMYTQVLMLVTIVLSFGLGFYLTNDIIATIVIYSIGCGAIFVFQIVRGYQFSKGLSVQEAPKGK